VPGADTTAFRSLAELSPQRLQSVTYEELGDSHTMAAVWRRFDEVLVFEPPNLEQLRRLLGVKLRGLRREFDPVDSRIAGLFKGMSHGGVERVIRRAAKEMILGGQEFLTERHLNSAIRREDARRARLRGV